MNNLGSTGPAVLILQNLVCLSAEQCDKNDNEWIIRSNMWLLFCPSSEETALSLT